MKKVTVGNAIENASQIVLGCMRIAGLPSEQVQRIVGTALDQGINMFDHADIYAAGRCEEVFSDAVKSLKIKREDIIIQSKCGNVVDQTESGPKKALYDSSYMHIISSVDGILKRLKTDYIDSLLIHRPDALADPYEIAHAFTTLKKEGKVLHFGVSNHNPMQIELLKKYYKGGIIANQLQLSITNSEIIDSGIYSNIQNEGKSIDRDGHVLNYCALNDITIQAWSPFNYGFFDGIFIDSPKFPELNAKLSELASKYSVDKSAIAVAWIMKHPSNIQPVVGTTKPDRIKNICRASEFEITKKEWYDLYQSTGKKIP